MSSEETLIGRRIPKRLWGLLQSPADTHALSMARRWLASDSPSLVMHGGTGCGKTFAAMWLVATHERGAAFVRGHALARWPAWKEPILEADEECPWRVNLRTVSLLLVDDVGGEQQADTIRATLQDLLDHRLDNGLRTVITTNLGMQEFGERYGAPMMSRIKLGGIVSVAGDDLRPRRELRSAEYVAPVQEQPKADDGPMVVPAIVEETLARWKSEIAEGSGEQ